MIVVRLNGGLGNQMFQYALGRRLAVCNNTELALDVTSMMNSNKIEGHTSRYYELGIFNIIEKFASSKDIKKFLFIDNRGRFISKIKNIINKSSYPYKIFEQRGRNFNEEALRLNKHAYLIGYWQSEKYFKKIDSILRKDFTFKYILEGLNNKISQVIRQVNSVSLHVRRGDYIANSHINTFHGLCSIEYYKKSIDYISKIINRPHFFIFSDDIAWIKQNLNIPFDKTYVANNQGTKDYVDMQLMSLCKHNIIANSSFSWWGAWLNNNPDKIVIAPKKWFNDESIDTKDRIPEGWIRI